MFNKLKLFAFEHWSFLTVCLLFILAYFTIWPIGEFAVNDDWLFVRQVEAFRLGLWKINALIDPSFVGQAFMGYLWSLLFGSTFTSLRLLTMFFTLFLLSGVYKVLVLVLKPLTIGTHKLIFIALMLVAFNPLILTSSMSFMTEIYFLAFFVWSVYFYLLHLITVDADAFSAKYIFLGSLMCAFSILIRHVGVITFLALGLLLLSQPKHYVRVFFVTFVPVVISVLLLFLWPRHGNAFFQNGLSEMIAINESAFNFSFSVVYLAFFLLPLLLASSAPKIFKYSALAAGLFMFPLLYNLDIFPIGNIFYLEGLYIKSNYNTYLSLFNNVLFKFFLAVVTIYAIVHILRFKKELLVRKDILFLIFTSFLHLAVLVFASDFYDRYLLPAFIGFLILFTINISHSTTSRLTNRLTYMALAIICLISLLLQNDFIAQSKLKWLFARQFQQETGYLTQISVDGVYLKYTNALKQNDYSGLIDTVPVEDYKCFVQMYTTESPLETLDISLSDPKIYDGKKPQNIPRITKNLSKLTRNQSYLSPLYNLVGKKAFVGGWCLVGL